MKGILDKYTKQGYSGNHVSAWQTQWYLIPRGNSESRGSGWSDRLPKEVGADDLAGHSVRERPFPRWSLLIPLLEYKREESLPPISSKKKLQIFDSLKSPTWSTPALHLSLPTPPFFTPTPTSLFYYFPLCSYCSSQTGLFHKHSRNSGIYCLRHLYSSLPHLDHFTLPGLITFPPDIGMATSAPFQYDVPRSAIPAFLYTHFLTLLQFFS